MIQQHRLSEAPPSEEAMMMTSGIMTKSRTDDDDDDWGSNVLSDTSHEYVSDGTEQTHPDLLSSSDSGSSGQGELVRQISFSDIIGRRGAATAFIEDDDLSSVSQEEAAHHQIISENVEEHEGVLQVFIADLKEMEKMHDATLAEYKTSASKDEVSTACASKLRRELDSVEARWNEHLSATFGEPRSDDDDNNPKLFPSEDELWAAEVGCRCFPRLRVKSLRRSMRRRNKKK